MIRRALPLALLLACTQPPARPAEPVPQPAPAIPRPPAKIRLLLEHPGASVDEVERDLAVPLELALAGIPDVAGTHSVSRSGRLELVLELTPGADTPAARFALTERLQAVAPNLPDDVVPFVRAEHDPLAAVVFTLHAPQVTGEQLRRTAAELRDLVVTVPGVTDVTLCGGREPELHITLDPARLAAHALSIDAIAEILRRELSDHPGFPGTTGRDLVRPNTLRDLDSVGTIIVRPGDVPVALRDIANVSLYPTLPACDALRLDGTPVVVATVHARRDTPQEKLTAAVRAALEPRAADLASRQFHLVLPAAPPRVLALDLPASADLPASLRSAVAGFSATTQTAVLQARPHPDFGKRFTADLIVFGDTTPELPPTANLLSVGTAADPLADPARHTAWVSGPDLDVDLELATRLADLARASPDVALALVRDPHAPELALELRRDRLADHRVPAPAVRDTIAAALGQLRVGALRTRESITPVILEIGEPGGAPPGALRWKDLGEQAQALTVQSPSGPVRLGDLIDVRLEVQRSEILRRDRQRVVAVDIRYTAAGPAPREALQRKVAESLQIPPGLSIAWD